MADRGVGSSEQYKKRTNRFILLLGLGLLILAMVAYCSMTGGGNRAPNIDAPIPVGTDRDPVTNPENPDFDPFTAGSGELEAQPSAVVMEGVVLGSLAETVVSLTAKNAPIIFIGMEWAEAMGQDGFSAVGSTCAPNKIIQRNQSCTIKVTWNPVSLRQIQNTLSIRWREDDPGVFSDKKLDLSVKAQSTDSKDCVICESPCKDKEVEKKREAVTFSGEVGEIDKDGNVIIGDKKYTVKDDLLIDENGETVGVPEPIKIPLGLDNKLLGTITKAGDVLDADGKGIGRLLGDDTIVDASLKVLGAAVPVVSVMDAQGKVIGKTLEDGTVIDGSGTVVGRPMVDGSVVNLEGTPIGYLRPYGLIISFTGDIVGGIIPNGMVVNGSQQVVGSVKPNGMAVNPNGELIGGVAPRGIAVGAACKSLGRVLLNGRVQDNFSQIIGKALLDGSVINEKSVDIGTVIRMGLVIDPKGAIVGFVNSEGKAVDGKGAVIGCVNPDGSVSAGDKIIGAVLPKGRVIGRGCKEVGSVYPNGVVMNAAVEVVGQVHPDAYVVNVNDRIIGVVVPRGAAIADGCRLLGLITPDGMVLDENGMSIGCITPEKQVVNKQNEVIGFVAPLGIVVDQNGKVIGRARPDGKVIDNDGKIIGCVNEDGSVVALDGKTVLGQLLGSNPGRASDGVVLNENGEATPWKVVGNEVIDENGKKIGTRQPNGWVVNDKGEIIGVIPPDGVIFSHDGLILGRYSTKTGVALTMSGERFGFVLPDYSVLNGEKDTIIGVLIPDQTPFMTTEGQYMATMTIEGVLQNSSGEALGVIKSNGTVVNRAGQVIGVRIPQGKVLSTIGKEVGSVNSKGEVVSTSKSVIGRVLGNGLALSNDGRVLGGVFSEMALPVGADGVIGSLTYQGKVNDARGRVIGTASPFGTVFGDKENLSGRLLRIGPYIDMSGKVIGWSNFKGGINDKSGTVIGSVSASGVALDADNEVLGVLVPRGIVVSGNGSFLSSVLTNGQVAQSDGQSVGLLNGYRYVANEKEGIVGQLLPVGIAVNAEGGLIGWTRFDGAIEDGNGVVGRVALNGRVMHADGTVLGTYLPLGTPALSTKGTFMGLVDGSGVLVSGRGEKVGTLNNDTYVFSDGRISGRLMQSTPAVTDNLTGRLVGMSGADGIVMVANDNKPLGSIMPNGLVVDLTKNVVAGQAPVGLAIGTKLNNMGTSLSVGQVVSKGNIVGYGIGTGIGAVYSPEGKMTGGVLPPASFIDRNGAFIGRSSGTSAIVNKDGKKLAEYMPFGSALTPDTIWAGGVVPTGLVINDDGYDIGVVTLDGTILGKDSVLLGRALSDGSAVGLSDKSVFSTMPYAGHTVKQGLPFGYRNSVLGRTTVGGDIIDASDKKVYRELDDGTILGNEMPLDGIVLSFNPATGHDGSLLGVLNGVGAVVSYAGSESGKIAVNGSVKGNHKYKILGALIPEQLVAHECKVIGQTSFEGQIINGQGSIVGRVTPDKWAVDASNNQIGRVVRVGLVSSPSGDYMGRTLPDSTVVDLNGVNMGCARDDGSVVNGSGEVIGHVVERGLVLDKDGNPIGRTKHDGVVVDKTGTVLGRVLGDGKGTVVNNSGDVIGRNVSPDEELMFNKDGTIAGTFSRNGTFKDPFGTEQFRVLPDGTIIDPKSGQKIGNLTADGRLTDINGNEISDIRVVRDQDGNYIGLVNDHGKIISRTGQEIGSVDKDGTIRGPDGSIMEGFTLAGVDLADIVPSMFKGGAAGATGGRRIFLGDRVFDVTAQGSLVDKDGNIIGYMGDDGRPYSLDDRLLSGKDERKLPPTAKKMVVHPEQSAAMDTLLATRRSEMKAKIHSFNRLLPDGKTLARARKKEDLDWGVAKNVSTYPVDMSRMILQDKAIPAVLAHSIDTEGGSEVPATAIVERHIYAEQGRRIIIPAGSRLIGKANGGGAAEHVAKIDISWERLIRPDGSAFNFSASSGDAQGRGGIAAYLDEQLLKKYGGPVLQSTLTSAIAFITATNDDITTKENGDQVLSSRAQAANDARSNFIDSMGQIFQQLLDEALKIKPKLFVPAGTRLTVYSTEDLWLRSEIEDELEYNAKFGADSKKAKGTSKGNWVAGRSGELSEQAETRGMQVDNSMGLVADEGAAYYNPDYDAGYGYEPAYGYDSAQAGMGGGAETIYSGDDVGDEEVISETGDDAGGSGKKESGTQPKPGSGGRVVNPIFPREQQQHQQRANKQLF